MGLHGELGVERLGDRHRLAKNVLMFEKTENRHKEAGMGQLKKQKTTHGHEPREKDNLFSAQTTKTDEKKEVTREHHQEIISNWVYHLSYFSRNFK